MWRVVAQVARPSPLLSAGLVLIALWGGDSDWLQRVAPCYAPRRWLAASVRPERRRLSLRSMVGRAQTSHPGSPLGAAKTVVVVVVVTFRPPYRRPASGYRLLQRRAWAEHLLPRPRAPSIPYVAGLLGLYGIRLVATAAEVLVSGTSRHPSTSPILLLWWSPHWVVLLWVCQ